MKIGILTHFHKSKNYGGVLQAYALCRYLNESGNNAKQILYTHTPIKVSSKRMSAKDIALKLCKKLKRTICKKRNKKIVEDIEKSFLKFRESVPHTEREYSKKDIREVKNDFDIFITGSDQVWNPIWFDSTYMLDFVDNNEKKLSYAASIGLSKLEREQSDLLQLYLSNFKSISVRENAAKDILSELVINSVEVLLDPTLLMNANDWDEIASKRIISEKYVFLYLLGDSIKTRRIAEKYAKKQNLLLVTIPDVNGEYRYIDRIIKSKRVCGATPNDFISLIKYSECVITDSFHACAFSLLYKKQFFAFEREGNDKINSRIKDLTEMLGIKEHFLGKASDKNANYLETLPQIDYKKEQIEFIKRKENSINYLKRNLS